MGLTTFRVQNAPNFGWGRNGGLGCFEFEKPQSCLNMGILVNLHPIERNCFVEGRFGRKNLIETIEKKIYFKS